MKYVVLDTETSGLFDFSKPADAEGQPRLAQIAMVYLDEFRDVERRYEALIKPDGWEMPPEIAEINGLTQERLMAEGQPIAAVLDEYVKAIHDGYIVVAHNAQYDTKIMRGELRRAGRDDLFQITQNICTMRAATGVCRIRSANGRGYKFPKLAEAMLHFKQPYADHHNAVADADACVALFRRMVEIGLKLEPKVHFAKEKPASAMDMFQQSVDLLGSHADTQVGTVSADHQEKQT